MAERVLRGEGERPEIDPGSPAAGTLAWVGPFAVFMLWLAIDKRLPIANPAKEVVRDLVLVAAIAGFSWRILPRRAAHWAASIALGLAVFALWVAPDFLVPGWRSSNVPKPADWIPIVP